MKALSSSKKPASRFILGIVIAAILVGVTTYAYLTTQNQQDTNSHDTSAVKEEQVANNSKNQSSLPSKKGTETSPNQPPQDTPPTSPEKPLVERAGGNPIIKVVATFQKASSGTCELQLTAPDQPTKTYTSNIVVGTSYYTCSFSIARNELPAASWSAVIVHRIGNAITSSDSRSID